MTGAKEQQRLEIKYVDVGVPQPWGRNPKLHDDQAIFKSLQRFGIIEPICILQAKTHRIIAGHGRLKAAKKSGAKEVPVIYVSMSDKEADAATIILNKTVEAGGWDHAKLKNIIDDLTISLPSLNLANFGFSVGDKELREYNPEYHLQFKTTKAQAERITEELHRLCETKGGKRPEGWREDMLVVMAVRSHDLDNKKSHRR